MLTDWDDRGRERTREVLAVEDRDTTFQEILDTYAHPGLASMWGSAGARWPTGTADTYRCQPL